MTAEAVRALRPTIVAAADVAAARYTGYRGYRDFDVLANDLIRIR